MAAMAAWLLNVVGIKKRKGLEIEVVWVGVRMAILYNYKS